MDKRKMVRDLAIATFAKFVEKYLYDTHWPTIATMCGVIDLLDQSKHE